LKKKKKEFKKKTCSQKRNRLSKKNKQN